MVVFLLPSINANFSLENSLPIPLKKRDFIVPVKTDRRRGWCEYSSLGNDAVQLRWMLMPIASFILIFADSTSHFQKWASRTTVFHLLRVIRFIVIFREWMKLACTCTRLLPVICTLWGSICKAFSLSQWKSFRPTLGEVFKTELSW